MKSIQARLQSRIARRSATIKAIAEIRDSGDGDTWFVLSHQLKILEADQKLDKEIISNVYWAG